MLDLLKRLCEVEGSSDEMEQHFMARTSKHVGLVQKAIEKIVGRNPEWKEFDENELVARGKVHDASKFEEPERTPYVSLTWRHKLEKEKGEFDPINSKGYKTPGMLDKEDENAATLHHIVTNSHHPEAHNEKQANINPKDRDKSVRVLDATKMPSLDIAEMVADWESMSQELKKNTAREWFNKVKDVRWHFSPKQEELIDKLLKVFEGEV